MKIFVFLKTGSIFKKPKLLFMKDSNETNKELVKLPKPLDREQRKRHRDDLVNNLRLEPKNPPVTKIKISDLKDLIKLSGTNTYLNFYLGTYREQADVERYNLRAGTSWTLDDLKSCPTLFIGLENEEFVSGDVYDFGTINPPPFD